MAEVWLQRYTANGSSYYFNLTAFNPTTYDEYIVRFNNLIRNNLTRQDGSGFPGQECFFIATNGGGLDGNNAHYLSGAYWCGYQPPTMQPLQMLNQGLFVNDLLGDPQAGICGDLRIYSPGLVGTTAIKTTWRSDVMRFDSSGSLPHISTYAGNYSGNPGGKITEMQILCDSDQNANRPFMSGYVDLIGITHT